MPWSYTERTPEILGRIRRYETATTSTVTLLEIPTEITALYHVGIGRTQSSSGTSWTAGVVYVDPDVGTMTVTTSGAPAWSGGTDSRDIIISCQGDTAVVVTGAMPTTQTTYWMADVTRIPD